MDGSQDSDYTIDFITSYLCDGGLWVFVTLAWTAPFFFF